uniref:Uncharacterized protein n=1 Tax=Lactuca sativa TaxID=4236 RepID=A0A9R1WG38_LACSA|nr:hypothetical protein LSAT_V11C200066590 [Lactuca sativa]
MQQACFFGAMKVINADKLMDDGEYEEILEDMREEGRKFVSYSLILDIWHSDHIAYEVLYQAKVTKNHQLRINPTNQSNHIVNFVSPNRSLKVLAHN